MATAPSLEIEPVAAPAVRGTLAVTGNRQSRDSGLLLRLGLTVATGGLHAIPWLFPGLWPAEWLAQAAAIALGAVCRPRSALAYGTAAGMLAIASSFYWGVAALRQTFDATPALAWTVFIGLVALEGLSFGVFTCTASIASRGGVRWMWLVPCAWVAIEYAFPRVFPWKLAYSQLECLPLIQIAELVGAGGIGLVVTAVCAIPTVIVLARRRDNSGRDRRWAIVFTVSAGLLLVATLIFGFVRLEQWSVWCAAQPKFKVALIQVDPVYVGAEKKLRERSLEIHDSVDLVCWPESALGTYSDRLDHFRDPAKAELLSRQSLDYLQPATGLTCHLLAGGKLYQEGAGPDGPYAQTAFLVSPDQDIVGRYRKRSLLPFGEYIPGQHWYPRAREWATLSEVVEAGNDPRPLVLANGFHLGVVICYEDMLPRNVRQTVAAGAEVIVSLIQGTAFENPLTLVQHQRLAALRAVENRRYFLRCASTGVTCMIAPTGAMVAQLPPQKDGTLVGEVSPTRLRTPYTTFGDCLPLLCGLSTFWGLLAAPRQRF